jgi:hypothetical protein
MPTRINPQIIEALLQQDQSGLGQDVYSGAAPIAPLNQLPPEVFMDMPNAGLGASFGVQTIKPNPAVEIANALLGQKSRR